MQDQCLYYLGWSANREVVICCPWSFIQLTALSGQCGSSSWGNEKVGLEKNKITRYRAMPHLNGRLFCPCILITIINNIKTL